MACKVSKYQSLDSASSCAPFIVSHRLSDRDADQDLALPQQIHWSRAMVKKIRWQELRRKLWSPVELPSARLFSEPEWQEHVSLWYVFYRWFIWGCWSLIVICSLFEIGSRRPEGKRQTWLIYLTHWDLILGTGQAFLGAFIVTRRRNLQRNRDFDPDSLVLGKTERTYWILYTIASSVALGVTILYWGAIYDPKIHPKDPLNFMLHLFNSVLMLVDLIIVGVPLRIQHFWWPLTCVFLYLIFTLFYYLAGGLDKNGLHYIYKILDWEKPGRTVLVCVGGLIFLTVVHCVLCSFARLRVYVRSKATGSIMSTAIVTPAFVKSGSLPTERALPTNKSNELIV